MGTPEEVGVPSLPESDDEPSGEEEGTRGVVPPSLDDETLAGATRLLEKTLG